jgi:hypothetical protein
LGQISIAPGQTDSPAGKKEKKTKLNNKQQQKDTWQRGQGALSAKEGRRAVLSQNCK